MKKIGLTGNFGSGKSTVAWMFQELGVPVIDADDIAHEVIAPHTKAWKQIFEHFGKGAIIEDGRIDRQWLADIVFRNAKERKVLESIIHPQVKEEIHHRIGALKREKMLYCLIEVPLLYEAHWDGEMDLVVVVKCDEETETERAVEKFGMSRDDVLRRLNAQMPLAKKISKADIVIDNSGPLEETRVQVERLSRAWERGDFSKGGTGASGSHEEDESSRNRQTMRKPLRR